MPRPKDAPSSAERVAEWNNPNVSVGDVSVLTAAIHRAPLASPGASLHLEEARQASRESQLAASSSSSLRSREEQREEDLASGTDNPLGYGSPPSSREALTSAIPPPALVPSSRGEPRWPTPGDVSDGAQGRGQVDGLTSRDRSNTEMDEGHRKHNPAAGATTMTPLLSHRSVDRDTAGTTARSTTQLSAVSLLDESTRETHQSLYTFQKRSVRHSYQNWRASPSSSNALCLPKPDDNLQATLDRLLHRQRLAPVAAKPKRKTSTKILIPSQLEQSGTAAGSTGGDVGVPPPQENSGTPQVKHDEEPPHIPQRQQLSRGSVQTPTASRLATPSEQTSVIPSHHQPPAQRPPSQLNLTELLLTPPSTASQLLTRNLLGFHPEDGHDSSLNLTFTNRDQSLQSPSAIAAAGGSVIGSLRPNSVMRLPPIAVSTSGDVPQQQHQDQDQNQGGASAHKPPLANFSKNKTTPVKQIEWIKKRNGMSSSTNVDTRNDQQTADCIGDPEEILVGGKGMFTVIPPIPRSMVTLDATTLDLPMPTLIVAGKGGLGNITSVSTPHKVLPKSHKEGPLRDEGTPHRLKTFGLSGTQSSASEGDHFLDDAVDGLSKLYVGLPTFSAAHLHISSGKGGGAVSPMRESLIRGSRSSVSPQRRQNRSTDNDSTAASLELGGNIVSSSNNINRQALAHRAAGSLASDRHDPVHQVAEVCRWGYDLRALFLVQLGRDQLTLPRFVLMRQQSLEPWIAWLQAGGYVTSGPNQNKRSSKDEQERDLVIRTASEYVGSTLFRGKNTVAPKYALNRASPVLQQPETQPQQAQIRSFDSSQRANVRKVFVEQGIQLADFCAMFRDRLGVDGDQRRVKEWLLDPRRHSVKVESCVSEFLDMVEPLRDHFMDCLRWNAEEREAMEYFAYVVEQHRPLVCITGQESQGAHDGDAHNDSHSGGGASRDANASRKWHAQADKDPAQLVLLMENLLKVQERRVGTKKQVNDDKTVALPPVSVEEFCAQRYLSHADVCSWLARSPTFDKNILRVIWAFVMEHFVARQKRMKPLECLQELYNAYTYATQVAASADDPGTIARGMPVKEKMRIRQLEGEAQRLCNASQELRDRAIYHLRHQHDGSSRHVAGKRASQDHFVLETVIAQLHMEDDMDRHHAAFHMALPPDLQASHVGSATAYTNATNNTSLGTSPPQPQWRELARRVVAHQELLYRQDAELLKHVITKRAAPHHRNGLEKAIVTWRSSGGVASPSETLPAASSTLIPLGDRPVDAIRRTAESHGALLPSPIGDVSWSSRMMVTMGEGGSVIETYQPVCKDTLESFLNIQPLVSDRVPPATLQFLREALQHA